MSEKEIQVEISGLRDGLQALYFESQEANCFGLKDPMVDAQKMLMRINEELLNAGAAYRCSTLLTGPSGGFIGLMVVVERNPGAKRDRLDIYRLDPGLNVISINSEEAEKFGLKENVETELTGKVNQVLQKLPRGASIADINSVPSNANGATIGILMTVVNS